MVSNLYAQNKVQNQVILKNLSEHQFLAKQGIAFRGHNEVESNFLQLLKLREIDNPELSSWMRRRTDKYVSPEMPNEILQLMSRIFCWICPRVSILLISFLYCQMNAQTCRIRNNWLSVSDG